MSKKTVTPLPEDEPNITQVDLPSKKGTKLSVQITAPKMMVHQFTLHGVSHLAVEKFSQKSRDLMEATQRAGSQARSKKQREPKNFDELYSLARYRSPEGWDGINASSIRNAMISACRLVGFKMVHAKLAVFVKGDGFDRDDGTPLLRIYTDMPQPENWISAVRNSSGVIDLRPRPRWDPGKWTLRPQIVWDSDMFAFEDVVNLLMRVGLQVGLCEGRPDSRNSPGLGYGLFEVETVAAEKAA